MSDSPEGKNYTDAPPAPDATILVVDDNPLIVNVLKGLLSTEGYEVAACSNGQEALELLEKKPVDVIVCDVMMPRMDGYQLHEQVRRLAKFSHIPFVFLSALGDQVEVSKGKSLGADDYLVKQFDPKDLVAVIQGKVQRARTIKGAETERYDSYRKKVIHTLSHEFRTPLVAINTGTELLLEQREKLDREKACNLLEAIRRGGERLEKLVNDFMLLQQIEGGVAKRLFDTRAAVYPVQPMIERLLEGRREFFVAERCVVKLIPYSREIRVRVYEPHIHDIVDRLLNNAIKFSAADRSIEVRLQPHDNQIAIEVRDRGIGIDPAKLREALDAFGQIDRDRLEQQGSGLGLAIASRYAIINGGRLEFEQREGGGTVVSLLLPIHRP